MFHLVNFIFIYFFKRFFPLLFLIYLFYFWLHWVFVAARGLFSTCGKGGLHFVAVGVLLTVVSSLPAEHGL